jgi:hypothetical protein
MEEKIGDEVFDVEKFKKFFGDKIFNKVCETRFIDEKNFRIIKEHYKLKALEEHITSILDLEKLDIAYGLGSNSELNYDSYVTKLTKQYENAINIIKPLLNDENLVICDDKYVKYKTNSYVVNDTASIEEIISHLNENKVVLLYHPIVKDDTIKFKVKSLTSC